MRGFPKWFNTRADVDCCLTEYPGEMKAQLGRWLEDRYCWQPAGELAPEDPGIEDETHMIETREDGSRWQIAYVEDPNCHLARLGITVEEAEGLTA